jgi:pyruvate kinase
MALVWGTHAVITPEVRNFQEVVDQATDTSRREEFASAGDKIVLTAGAPLGTPGATNVLRIAWIN